MRLVAVISLYELEVYGRPSSAADTDLMGVEISSADEVLKQGQPTTLTIQGYAYARQPIPVAAAWSSPDGTFRDNDFIPAAYGMVTVTAATSGMTATKTLPVEESLHLTSLTFDVPGILVKDTPTTFTIEGRDQFGASFDETPVYETSSPALTIDADNHTIVATAAGSYTVTARMGSTEAVAEVMVISSAVEAPAVLTDKVVVFVGDEEPSMNFAYNGASQPTGASFLLTPRCRAIYVKELGTCGFGALGNLELNGANMLHADIYALHDAPLFSIHIEGSPGNREYAKALKGGQWNSLDLPITNTTANWLFFAFSNYQSGNNAALIANVYFYTETGDRIYVSDPDSRGIVSVTTFGTGVTDDNVADFLTDLAALPSTATAIDLSHLALTNTAPMTISTPNNPNVILLLAGDGGDDNAASAQQSRLANTRNLAYDAGGWILPLKATGYQVSFTDGYPVLPMNFGRCTALTYTRTLAAGTYATSCLPREVSIPEGITAYQLADTQGETITFDRVATGTMSAYRPYLLYNSTEAPVTLSINGSQGNVELARSNADLTARTDDIRFTGNFQQFQVNVNEGYVAFRPDGFLTSLSIAGTTVGAFRAYLTGITAEQLAGGVTIDGELFTGISAPRQQRADSDVIYSLTGTRVTQPRKGLYIINGKKVLVR